MPCITGAFHHTTRCCDRCYDKGQSTIAFGFAPNTDDLKVGSDMMAKMKKEIYRRKNCQMCFARGVHSHM